MTTINETVPMILSHEGDALQFRSFDSQVGSQFPIHFLIFAPAGGLCTACRNQPTTTKQIRKIVMFFPGFPGVRGLGIIL